MQGEPESSRVDDDVSFALKNVESSGGTLGYNPDLPPDEQILPSIPEPRHGKVRRVISGVIAPHRLAPVEPFVAALSEQLLSKIVGIGPVDLVPTLVDPIPTEAMAFVFGIPREEAARFGEMSDEFLEGQFRIVNSGIGAVHPEFTRYVEALIAARKHEAEPPDDVITRLLHADLDGEPLSDVAVRTQMMMLIMAGNETTRNLLGNCLLTLARRPEVFAAMKRDSAVVDVVIEESLRFDAPVQMLFRTCMRPATVDTTNLAESEQVQLCLGSANRDDRHYESPDEFRIDRANPRTTSRSASARTFVREQRLPAWRCESYLATSQRWSSRSLSSRSLLPPSIRPSSVAVSKVCGSSFTRLSPANDVSSLRHEEFANLGQGSLGPNAHP